MQEALAGELEMQAIYDVVGDKIEEIFDAQGVAIAILDEPAAMVSFPYLVERGERLRPEPVPFTVGFTKPCSRRGAADDRREHRGRSRAVWRVCGGRRDAEVAVWVPLFSGGRANGVISLDNFDREHAFGESDQQLLETLAGSLSVASRTRGSCTRRGSGTPSSG